MLRAEGVGVRRGGRALLDGVSLCLRAGEFTAVCGPNGAGKSTLLACLAGEFAPDAGRILLNGAPLSDYSPRRLARLRALLPQESRLAFDFSALEVVLMGRAPHHRGRPGPVDRQAAHAALRATDAWQFADRPYPQLSGGEKARVQLARVLAQVWRDGAASEAGPRRESGPWPESEPRTGIDPRLGPASGSEAGLGPRLLLLDEPTASLDLAHQHAALAAVRRLGRNQDLAVACVLHDLNLAARYADRVLLLRDGRVAAFDTPARALTAERLRAVYGVEVQILTHPDDGGPVVLTAARDA